jgi:hypothetical protein
MHLNFDTLRESAASRILKKSGEMGKIPNMTPRIEKNNFSTLMNKHGQDLFEKSNIEERNVKTASRKISGLLS